MKNNIKDLEKSFDSIEIPAELDLTIEKAIQTGKKLKRKKTTFRLLSTAASIALIICSATILGIATGKLPLLSQNKKLPVVGNVDNLKTLLADTFPKQENSVEMSANNDKSAENYNGPENNIMNKSVDYSATNTQVAGIDEGDDIKTDGKYIYKFAYSHSPEQTIDLQIIKALPAENMSLIKEIDLKDMCPMQMFLNNNYLIVIGALYPPVSTDIEAHQRQNSTIHIIPFSTVVNIYDIHDKSNVNLVRHLEIDGNFTTARMINSHLYFICNKYIYKDWIEKAGAGTQLLPTYKDSVIGSVTNNINLNQVNYFPDALEPNYIIIGSIDLNKINHKIMITATLGSGHNIFCSKNNLYVAGYNFSQNKNYNTTIYKFRLTDGSPIFVASATVPGNISDQFSMDEFNKYFRVAITSSTVTGSSSSTTSNLYILDENMKLVGQLEGLAKGERIEYTKFIEDRAYMVPSQHYDPLFVIDLRNPATPKFLGELKLPGYYMYLQPYDKNTLLNLDMNTETVNDSISGNFLPKGLKLALFDVSDVNNPKQKFMTTLGDVHTNSPALSDQGSLFFSNRKNLLSFPVTISEAKKDKNGGEIFNDIFQGAYVYNVDLTNGFTLKGIITHMTTQDQSNKDFNPNSMISNVLYINNTLYTISESTIKANDINDLKEISSLKLR